MDLFNVIWAVVCAVVAGFSMLLSVINGKKKTPTNATDAIKLVASMLPDISNIANALSGEAPEAEKKQYVINYITNIFSALDVNIGSNEHAELTAVIDEILKAAEEKSE